MLDIAALTFDERLSPLPEREKTEWAQQRYVRLKALARLHLDATIEDLNFKAPRGLDRSFIMRLASEQWVRDGRTVVVSGATGPGKRYLAPRARSPGLPPRYLDPLIQRLAPARRTHSRVGTGRTPRLIQRLARTRLLILDNWGSLRSRDREDTTSSKSSMTGTPVAGRCSRAKSPLTTGTMSSATPPSAMPSSTGSSTTLIGKTRKGASMERLYDSTKSGSNASRKYGRAGPCRLIVG